MFAPQETIKENFQIKPVILAQGFDDIDEILLSGRTREESIRILKAKNNDANEEEEKKEPPEL